MNMCGGQLNTMANMLTDKYLDEKALKARCLAASRVPSRAASPGTLTLPGRDLPSAVGAGGRG